MSRCPILRQICVYQRNAPTRRTFTENPTFLLAEFEIMQSPFCQGNNPRSLQGNWPCAGWGLIPVNTKGDNSQMQHEPVFLLNEGD
jgi:hypothetical protein